MTRPAFCCKRLTRRRSRLEGAAMCFLRYVFFDVGRVPRENREGLSPGPRGKISCLAQVGIVHQTPMDLRAQSRNPARKARRTKGPAQRGALITQKLKGNLSFRTAALAVRNLMPSRVLNGGKEISK